jgi:hypothetical protein
MGHAVLRTWPIVTLKFRQGVDFSAHFGAAGRVRAGV